MATPNTTDATHESNDPKTNAFDPEDLISEDPKFENLKMEELSSVDVRPENATIEDVTLEDGTAEDGTPEGVKSECDEAQVPHAATLTIVPSQPITVTSDHWKKTLEKLLRFPGMVPRREMRLFRPGNPIGEIAFALGVTDSAYTITESSWVPIAERIFEVQTCCMMHAKHITFDVTADGWITWDITAEWYDRILQDLQGKGFQTTCTAMVAFVARVYLQTSSWIKYRVYRGSQGHKQVMDYLRHKPGADAIKHCSMMAKGFTSVVRLSRKKAIQQAEKQYSPHEPPSHSDEDV